MGKASPVTAVLRAISGHLLRNPLRGMNLQLYNNAVAFISRLDRRSTWTRYVGWVYALRNREFRKPLLKIGMTTTSPHQRPHELGSATGVSGRFDLVYFVHTVNCAVAEHHVHQKLADYRTTGEFRGAHRYRGRCDG